MLSCTSPVNPAISIRALLRPDRDSPCENLLAPPHGITCAQGPRRVDSDRIPPLWDIEEGSSEGKSCGSKLKIGISIIDYPSESDRYPFPSTNSRVVPDYKSLLEQRPRIPQRKLSFSERWAARTPSGASKFGQTGFHNSRVPTTMSRRSS